MTCNNQMSAFGIIQSVPRKKIYFFFGLDDLLYSNDAHWEIASRHGEESCRSSKERFCKSVSEERFAHKREIRGFENPLKRGLCSRPKINNSASLAAFTRTSAFRPPVAYFKGGREIGANVRDFGGEINYCPLFSRPMRGWWPSPRPCTQNRHPFILPARRIARAVPRLIFLLAFGISCGRSSQERRS